MKTKKVAIVSFAGLTKSGKSFLANQFVAHHADAEISSSLQ
jgi:adenylylsulfate kinase-like enzyme